MEFLRFLESLRTPFLDFFMSIVTYGGSELVFMLIALIFFWCVSKKTGYYILVVGFFGTAINQISKLLFHVPRPWVLDPEFTIVESARAGATGYSFPSGHTQTAVGTYSCLFLSTKRRAVKIICVILILLVPFSRMYLGVHTPLDVGVAFVTALLLAALFRPAVEKANTSPRLMTGILLSMVAVCLGFLVFVTCYTFPADIDLENLAEGTKNAYTLTGALLGLVLSYWLDNRYIHFSTSAPIGVQIGKVLVGLVLILLVKEGLKTPLNLLFGGHYIATSIRYFCTVLVAGAAWPACFTWYSKHLKVSP